MVSVVAADSKRKESFEEDLRCPGQYHDFALRPVF